MWQIINAYLSGVLTTIELLFFSKIVTKEKIKKPQFKAITTIIILSMFYAILSLNITGTVKTLLIFFINILICKYLYNITYKKSIFLNFLWYITLMIPDSLFLLIVIELLGYSKEFCYETIAGSVISNVIVCVLFIIIIYLIRKILRRIINCKVENNKKIIILSILTFICIVITFYNTFSNIIINKNSIISIFSMIILILILFSLGKQTIENNRLYR